MANWISITRIAQHTYGVLALQVGIPMNVYRITSSSNGDWIQPNNLFASNIRVDRQPMKKGDKGFESAKNLDTFWYELMADCTPFLVGDVFVSNDTVLNQGSVVTTFPNHEFIGLCLAENMPTRAPIAARINTTAQLYTPALVPNRQSYYDSTLPNKMPIICMDGQFQALNNGQIASFIPIAFMPARAAGNIYHQPTANVTQQERRLIYTPPLNGYRVIPGDEFVLPTGARYVVVGNYSQDSGTSGGQFLVEKVVSGGP